MVTSNDFVQLDYTSDLTKAGIVYACRSLAYTYDRMGGSLLNRMRRIVAGVAVELAFRRFLDSKGVPYDILGVTPFTEPDRYDIAIGGRRCDVKSFLILQKKRIQLIQQKPDRLLSAQALVPIDQACSSHATDSDIFIFAFLNALITPNLRTLSKALQARQPVHLIHVMPAHWSRPRSWESLGRLVLKSDFSQSIEVEVGGQNREKAFQVEHINLPPRQRTCLQKDFYTVSYLHVPWLPPRMIGIHSPSLEETYLIQPVEWGNIWIYGFQIILTGYLSRGEFRQEACNLPAGSQVFQYSQTRADNLALPIQQLKPVAELVNAARMWPQPPSLP